MSNYKILCASTVDLPLEHLEKRELYPILFHFNIDGKQYDDDFGKTISYEEFFKKIENGAMPTTSQINVEEHMIFLEEFLKNGDDIIYIAFSSGLSGSFSSACVAVEELKEKYPERKIYIVDSMAASSGYGLLVDMAADLRDEGKSIEEVYDWLEENKLNIHHWFFSTDLSHYRRGGRISGTAAAIGTLLNICPLLNMDNQGCLKQRRKVRSKKSVIKEIVKEMEAHVKDGYDYSGKCFMCNSACSEDAELVAKLVEEKFKKLDGKVMINSIGTVIGSHTGPGTVALFFVGDKRED